MQTDARLPHLRASGHVQQNKSSVETFVICKTYCILTTTLSCCNWHWNEIFRHFWLISWFLFPGAAAFSVLVLHDWTRLLHVASLQRCIRRQAKSEWAKHKLKTLPKLKRSIFFIEIPTIYSFFCISITEVYKDFQEIQLRCGMLSAVLRIVNILLALLWKISYLTEHFVNNINLDFYIVGF